MRISKKGVAGALAAIAALALLVLFRHAVAQVLLIVLPSLLAAYLSCPLLQWLEARMPRRAALSLLFAVFFGAVGATVYFTLPLLIGQVRLLSQNASLYRSYFENALGAFERFLTDTGLMPGIAQALGERLGSLEQALGAWTLEGMDAAVRLVGQLPALLLIPVVSFYLLRDREYFRVHFLQLIPVRHRNGAIWLFRALDRDISRYIRGQLLLSAVVGLATALFLLAAGMQFWLALGIWMGLCNIIPYFGPIAGGIPIIMLGIPFGIDYVLVLLLGIVVIQQLESGLLAPKILGDQTGIHPVYVMLALIAGAAIGGIAGMLFALPVALMIRTIATMFRKGYIRATDYREEDGNPLKNPPAWSIMKKDKPNAYQRREGEIRDERISGHGTVSSGTRSRRNAQDRTDDGVSGAQGEGI